MKSFVFKLQAILQIREQLKEECLRTYAHALQKRVLQEKLCNELQEKIRMLCNSDKSVRTFEPAERIRIWNAVTVMTEKLKREKDLLDQLKKEEAECLKLLLGAKMSLEVLNKLKEKQERFFYANELKVEEKFLDDWVNRAFGIGMVKS